MLAEHYDALIVGSGEAGKYLAWHLGKSGKRVAVVERKLIGGSCPNTNCLPSKNEIWSAEVAHIVRHSEAFGSITGPVRIDMARVLARKREMVDGLVATHLDLFRQSGVALIMGHARFKAPRTVEVTLNAGGTATISGDQMFINVGTHATIPDVPGLAAAKPMTHVEILELGRLPGHLVVLGGGYVALEMAQAYRRFGAEVTILERGSQILSREDADIAEELTGLLRAEGVAIRLNTKVTRVAGRSGDRVTVETDDGVIEATDILVAAGRTPNTGGIGLELAGVRLDERGYIAVNDRLETDAAGTWAMGESAGSPEFTHAAFDDFRIIRDNLAGGNRSKVDRLIPSCLFTDPQLGRVGLSENEAKAQNIPVRVARHPVKGILRARTMSETRGFMKVLIGKDDCILGFAMLGPDASEIIATVQTAMLAEMRYQVLRDAIFAHPTMAEALGPLLSKV